MIGVPVNVRPPEAVLLFPGLNVTGVAPYEPGIVAPPTMLRILVCNEMRAVFATAIS